MSLVHFVSSGATSAERNHAKFLRLLRRVRLQRIITAGDLVAIKLSFAERGNFGYIRPQFVRMLVDEVMRLGGKPFLTDTNTLYSGERDNSRDHTLLALEHGFGYNATGAPIVIADGLLGQEYRLVPLNGYHFSEARVSSVALDADVIISFSHFKGHMVCGFGGTLKNLGMGFAARSGKRLMHSGAHPGIDTLACDGCANCSTSCREVAISIPEETPFPIAKIDPELCIGCGECMISCPNDAIQFTPKADYSDREIRRFLITKMKNQMPLQTREKLKQLLGGKERWWRAHLRSVAQPTLVQERIAEYAAAALYEKQDKFLAINLIMDVTPDCDCLGWSDNAIVPDIGIAASLDPVALDTASLDLVNQCDSSGDRSINSERTAYGDKFSNFHSGIDATAQLEHGERIGLGERAYILIPLDKEAPEDA